MFQVIIGARIYCYCHYSCAKSLINNYNHTLSTEGVYCYGDSSCTYSTIINSTDIIASGNYSLYSAVIQSGGKGIEVVLYLTGNLAAYNASVFCYSNDTCEIYCFDNACYNTSIFCDSSDNCNIYCNDSFINSYCPVVYVLDNIDSNTPEIVTAVGRIEIYETMSENENQYTFVETQCTVDDVTNNFTIDCQDTSDTDCTNLGYDLAVNKDDSNICCRASFSCYSTNSIITTGDNGNIHCNGQHSCYGSSLNYVTIRSNNNVYCGGYLGCNYARITAVNGIYCPSLNGCYNSIMYGSKELYCGGQASCRGTILNVNNVYLTASQAAVFTDLHSNGTDVKISAKSYRSGQGLTVYCDIGDECEIYCETKYACSIDDGGINTMTLICNGSCLVYCDYKYNATASDDHDANLRCPTNMFGNYTILNTSKNIDSYNINYQNTMDTTTSTVNINSVSISETTPDLVDTSSNDSNVSNLLILSTIGETDETHSTNSAGSTSTVVNTLLAESTASELQQSRKNSNNDDFDTVTMIVVVVISFLIFCILVASIVILRNGKMNTQKHEKNTKIIAEHVNDMAVDTIRQGSSMSKEINIVHIDTNGATQTVGEDANISNIIADTGVENDDQIEGEGDDDHDINHDYGDGRNLNITKPDDIANESFAKEIKDQAFIQESIVIEDIVDHINTAQ